MSFSSGALLLHAENDRGLAQGPDPEWKSKAMALFSESIIVTGDTNNPKKSSGAEELLMAASTAAHF